MKQVNKITLFYDDGTFQDIIVPTQVMSLPTRFSVNQLLQEVSATDPTKKSYGEVLPEARGAWIQGMRIADEDKPWTPQDSAAEKKAARAFIRANWPFPK